MRVGDVYKFYPLKRETIGIKLKAKDVGIAVLRHNNVLDLSFSKQYRKKVPNDNVIKMRASKRPINKSPTPNLFYKLCLLKLYVILII